MQSVDCVDGIAIGPERSESEVVSEGLDFCVGWDLGKLEMISVIKLLRFS